MYICSALLDWYTIELFVGILLRYHLHSRHEDATDGRRDTSRSIPTGRCYNPMYTASGDSIIRLAAQDAKAAIRMVRQHADEWNISKDKIGYLGFSAGGGVAIAATMSADSMERPNFLCTNFGPSLMPVTVPQDAPPLLIMTRADHPNVAAGLIALFMEWKKSGANAELHMYGDGKGPYELMPQTDETTTETWSSQMIHWLKAKGFISKN